jgi:hypothetical protein
MNDNIHIYPQNKTNPFHVIYSYLIYFRKISNSFE